MMDVQHSEIDITAKLPIVIINCSRQLESNGIVKINESQLHTCEHNNNTSNNNKNNSNDNNTFNLNLECNGASGDITINLNLNNINGSSDKNRIDLRKSKPLPNPSFRLSKNESYSKRKHTPKTDLKNRLIESKDCYYHYIEPTAEELMELIEYDMDETDTKWLSQFNQKHQPIYKYTISPDDFELVMDRLEKESFFESKSSGKLEPLIDEDAVCAICNDGEGYNTNAILFCDMCNLAVHQECYGVPYVPEGQWLCRRCLQSPSTNVECVFCPNKGGAFKQTEDNRWAHVICALWIPEVCFANTVFLEPIDNIQKIPAARWKLLCYICKQKKSGACIQCHNSNCYLPFHVTCAQQAGLYMKIQPYKYNTSDGVVSDVKKEAFCDAHAPDEHDRGGGMYSSQDSSDDDDEKRLRMTKARNKMKATRKILAEKRVIAFNPISIPTVKPERIEQISKVLVDRSKRKKINRRWDEFKQTFMREILEHWKKKRNQRNGVPLIRRLQVSYNNSLAKSPSSNIKNDEHIRGIRYDLEKARLLVGQVKKREILKRNYLTISKKFIEMKFLQYDREYPTID